MNRRELLGVGLAAPLSAAVARGAPSVSTALRGSKFDPWIEINPAHLRHNVAQVRRHVANRPILAVIKNNAYGLGVCEIGRVLQDEAGIAGFAVVKLHEAVALREAGIKKPILLMGPFDVDELDEMVARDITAMIYRPMSREIAKVTRKRQKRVQAHVCIDTGIGRVGVPLRQARALLAQLGADRAVALEGVQMTFTEDPEFDREQLRRFLTLCTAAERSGLRLGNKHAASSDALFTHRESFLDMVRPGMALFGCYPEPRYRDLRVLELKPGFALRTRVIYVKRLETADSAGYGRAYRAAAPVWLATLPVGHTDGLPRTLVKGARVRIGMRHYPIVGVVSASHCLVEIGAQKTVEIGDEATLFDWQEGSRPEDQAAASGGSAYDLLMHLNPLLPKRFVGTL